MTTSSDLDRQRRCHLEIRCEAAQIGIALISATSGRPQANAAFFEVAGIPVNDAGNVIVDVNNCISLMTSSRESSGIPTGYRAVFDSADGHPIHVCLIDLTALAGQESNMLLAVERGAADKPLSEFLFGTDDKQFKYFIEHLPAGVVVHDRDGCVIGANTLAASLLGLSMEEITGKSAFDSIWKFYLSDGKPMPKAEFPATKSLTLQRNLQNIVVGIRHTVTDTITWVICNTLIVKDAGGSIAKVVVSFTDCTELKNAQEALRSSEERLNLILRGTNDAPWDWDLLNNKIYYSDKWWAMIGRAPGELPADPELWRRLLHPDDILKVAETFGPALENGTNYEVEFRLQHKDGYYVPVLSRGFVLRNEFGMAVRVSGTNTDLSERKRTEARIHQLAYFDQLTGLPNRRYLIEHLHKVLSRAARTGQMGAVLFLDLDNFKDLNDTLGHNMGDLMLRQFADRLQHLLRESDQMARLGGDEFVIVVEDLATSPVHAAEEAEAIANKVVEAASRKFFLPNKDYTITPSVGIALFDRTAGSVEAVLKQADLAMYGAKSAGRGLIRFFDPEMQRAVDARSEMEIALRNALAGNEFELHCQPQFDHDQRLIGGEMLLRWRHPEKGLIGPTSFISTAEACGLMVPIGAWVLREACRVIASWATNPVLGQLMFSINVNAQQLHSKEFVRQTLDVFTSTKAEPRRVCLELTESLLAQDVHDVTEKMCALRDHGLVFSIDDFGTGYSSLSYLQRFPLHALKIDKSFVHDTNANAIVEVIIALANKLALRVVAEGIETTSQYELLKAKGCEFFQGFYLGLPMPLDAFVETYGGAQHG